MCSYGYRQDLARAFATKISPLVIEYKREQRSRTLCLSLAMATCFMSNQTCHIGGCCGFCLIHTQYFFTGSYYSSLLVKTPPLCCYGATRVWNMCAFIIWLIPGCPPPFHLPTGETGMRLLAHINAFRVLNMHNLGVYRHLFKFKDYVGTSVFLSMLVPTLKEECCVCIL